MRQDCGKRGQTVKYVLYDLDRDFGLYLCQRRKQQLLLIGPENLTEKLVMLLAVFFFFFGGLKSQSVSMFPSLLTLRACHLPIICF